MPRAAYAPTMQSVRDRHAVQLAGVESSRPMLFAQGFGCDQTMWRMVAPAFERSFKVVTFDYVGAGRSDRSAYDLARYSSLDGYVQDVLEICSDLGLRDVTFVGHSVSAMIGILASIAEPDRFRELILIAPSPRYLDDPPTYRGGFTRGDIDGLLDMMDLNALGWASFLAPLVMANPEQPVLTAELEASFCSIDPVMARQFAEVTFLSDSRIDLGRVTTPSLIVQCVEDAVAPPEVGAFLARELPGSTLRVIAATGHCPHVSHPDLVIDAMAEYLKVTTRRQDASRR